MDDTMDNTRIRSIRPEWTLVMDRMLLVTLHVGRWRAATRSEFQEFGLDAAAFSAYTAGTRHLLPRRLQGELDLLERMARELLARYSFRTLFGYMMPKEKYEEFKAWIDERPAAALRKYLHGKDRTPDAWQTQSLRDRWFALGQDIAAARDRIVDEVVEAYRPSAEVRWRVENGLPKNAAVLPPDAWLNGVLEDMVRRIPTAGDIRASFRLDVVPAFVEAPDEAVKAAKLEDITRQEAELARRLRALDNIRLEQEREQARLAILADREKLERERRITEEVIQHEKRLKQERIDSALDAVAGQLHTLVYGAVCDGLSMVQAKGCLHPRYVGRLKGLVEQVRLLNFTDDTELSRVCDDLERMAGQNAASKASAENARDVLVNAGISLKADLVAASIPTRSARDLGIPDAPLPDLVRQARRQAREVDLFSPAEAGESPEPLARAARSLETAPAKIAANATTPATATA